MRADTLGWLPIRMFPIGSSNSDIADMWVQMVLYFNPFSYNSVKKSSTQFIFDLVGDLLVRTPAIPILPSWLVMVDWRRSPIVSDKVGSYILSVSKFCLRLPRSLVAVNSALRVDSTFLQDLSVDLWVLVEVMSFLQTFLEVLGTMVGLAILELLWGLDPDLYLLSEEPFLWV